MALDILNSNVGLMLSLDTENVIIIVYYILVWLDNHSIKGKTI